MIERAPPIGQGPYKVWMEGRICGTHVGGTLTIEQAVYPVRMSDCLDDPNHYRPNSVAGSLVLRDNAALLYVAGQVAGDAVCRDNGHHPRTGTDPLVVAGVSSCPGLPGGAP